MSASLAILELDGARFCDLDGFYDEVSRVLVPGRSWGRNLDAFNDILRGGFGTPDSGFRLVWCNSAKSRRDLGYVETARVLEQRLVSCHPENRADVSGHLHAARSGQGPTVFDTIVQIIRGHAAIVLELA